MPRMTAEAEVAASEAILRAAARRIARDGFRGMRLADVCGEAGIPSGRLYRFFASKEAIAAALLRRRLVALPGEIEGAGPLDAALRPPRDPMAADRVVVELLAEATRNALLAATLREHDEARARLLAGAVRGPEGPGADPGPEALRAAALLVLASHAMALARCLPWPGAGEIDLEPLLRDGLRLRLERAIR